MRKKAIGVVLVLAAFLSACGGGAESYGSVSELRSAVAEAGIACDDFEAGEPADLVSERGVCVSSDLELYIFGSESDREDWLKVATRLGATAYGPDWAVAGPEDDVKRVADELGATLADS